MAQYSMGLAELEDRRVKTHTPSVGNRHSPTCNERTHSRSRGRNNARGQAAMSVGTEIARRLIAHVRGGRTGGSERARRLERRLESSGSWHSATAADGAIGSLASHWRMPLVKEGLGLELRHEERTVLLLRHIVVPLDDLHESAFECWPHTRAKSGHD